MSDRGFDRLLDELLANPPPRTRVRSPGAALALENAEIAVRDDPVRIANESAERRASRIIFKAMMLSGGDLEVCEALLRDEHVPVSRLDPKWVERYGLREGQGVAGEG